MTMFGSMHHIVRNKPMKQYKTILIKIGGSILSDLSNSFYRELIGMVAYGWFPVIVHGGGPSITKMLNQLGIESNFINGLRVTDEKTLQVVEMVLNGKENKEIVRQIQMAGGNAVGLSGIDHRIIQAEPLHSLLGYVGKIKKIEFPWLDIFQAQNIIPVISPLGIDQQGQIYNINADTVAQALAVHLQAKKLLMISDIPGIYQTEKGEKRIIHQLNPQGIDQLIANGEISEGMIPKVEAAVQCLETGIEDVYVVDGRLEGIVSKILDQEQVGTRICKAEMVL
ncbi:acetylglutamate kinase [Tepidibacillus marianensis]|uniref:acetylglutamate kinase n=1 Tax=Tepidibacillus marianensis TaxID=3131995 RepID=UPI0030CFC118